MTIPRPARDAVAIDQRTLGRHQRTIERQGCAGVGRTRSERGVDSSRPSLCAAAANRFTAASSGNSTVLSAGPGLLLYFVDEIAQPQPRTER